jgi:hypothetical protein
MEASNRYAVRVRIIYRMFWTQNPLYQVAVCVPQILRHTTAVPPVA